MFYEILNITICTAMNELVFLKILSEVYNYFVSS